MVSVFDRQKCAILAGTRAYAPISSGCTEDRLTRIPYRRTSLPSRPRCSRRSDACVGGHARSRRRCGCEERRARACFPGSPETTSIHCSDWNICSVARPCGRALARSAPPASKATSVQLNVPKAIGGTSYACHQFTGYCLRQGRMSGPILCAALDAFLRRHFTFGAIAGPWLLYRARGPSGLGDAQSQITRCVENSFVDQFAPREHA